MKEEGLGVSRFLLANLAVSVLTLLVVIATFYIVARVL